MFKLLGSAAFLAAIGLANAGYAADLSVSTPPQAPIESPVFTWTGFYVGVNGGGAFGGKDDFGLHSGDVFLGKFGKLEGSGFFGGGQIGYNYQVDQNWVIGLETDFQGGNIRDSLSNDGAHATSKVNWFGTLRPRVGYAYDNTLFYGTGGLAYGHIDYKASLEGVGSFDESKTKAGWVLGAGVEHAFTDHLTAKLEYQYVDFGKFNAGGDDLWSKATVDFHSIRVGLNYKF
ncbi:outer membrane protein [Rhizobium sp. BK602]|uniref:outer membrane protein n=1 Tax=Rhizobium sp. BK602 TaxID=2586986 RepID=UPI00160F3747|nr:outer membrane protein [Rhizobium sp. BK602]MBB3609282.1 outer membrane immunogenic protein [Rhizobium sp. BK602]